MIENKRPLSPHLQVYKPQLTSILSITHRATGIVLSVGALFLSLWLVALANGAEKFQIVQGYMNAWPVKCLLVGLLFSFYYHLTNGIRHLFWDAGVGLDLNSTYQSGYLVLGATIVLTLVTLSLVM